MVTDLMGHWQAGFLTLATLAGFLTCFAGLLTALIGLLTCL